MTFGQTGWRKVPWDYPDPARAMFRFCAFGDAADAHLCNGGGSER